MVFAPCMEMRDRLFQQEMGGFHVARRGRREKAQGVWVVDGVGSGGGLMIAHTGLRRDYNSPINSGRRVSMLV